MRWKLANGNVIASTKQPLQNKDFDRIEIEDDYETWYEDNGTFEEAGGPPADGDIEFTVRLYNPSTHTVRKSHHDNASVYLAFGPMNPNVGGIGGSYSSRIPYESYYDGDNDGRVVVADICQGDVCEFHFYSPLVYSREHYNHQVNPFNYDWGYAKKDGKKPYQNYENSTYQQRYACKLRIRTGGGRRKELRNNQTVYHAINYKVR